MGWASRLLAPLVLSAAGAAAGGHSPPPLPVEGWAARPSVLPGANPFAALPRLPKPHYSWPICGIARSMAGCIRRSDQTLVDFARVTGVLPLGIDGVNAQSQWDTSFDNATLPEAVAICAAANCSLGLVYSPWNQFFPSKDPLIEGDTPLPFTAGGHQRVGSEAKELSFFRSRLQGVASGLAAANARAGLSGADAVAVSAVLIDSEIFGSDCPNVNCSSAQQAAIQRKHDLIYNASSETFPLAGYDAFDRGAIGHTSYGDQTLDRVPPFEKWHGGFEYVGGRGGGASHALLVVLPLSLKQGSLRACRFFRRGSVPSLRAGIHPPVLQCHRQQLRRPQRLLQCLRHALARPRLWVSPHDR